MDIATRIRQVRDFWDLTQQNVADICGVTNAAVSQWENRVAIPRIQHLRKLADYLNIPVSTLVADDVKLPELEQIEHYFISMNDAGQQAALAMMQGLAKNYPKGE